MGLFDFLKKNNKKEAVVKDTESRKPIKSIDEGRNYVDNHFKNIEETLWISNNLLDPMGLNMAIICDGILKLGYMPDGFDQKNGYRIYKYKKD